MKTIIRTRLFIAVFICVFANIHSLGQNMFDFIRHDFICDGFAYQINKEDSSTVMLVNDDDEGYFNCTYSGAIVIPEQITYDSKTYTVNKIGSQAFWNCTGVTSILIPESIIEIGGSAFSYTSITSVVIPKSVTTMGPFAFWECNKLEDVIWNPIRCNGWPASGDQPFYKTGVKIFTFGDSVELIPEGLGNGLSRVKSLVIPPSVKTIEYGGLINCSGLEEIVIPETVDSVFTMSLAGCHGLKRVVWNTPSSIDYIYYSPFGRNYFYENLEEFVFGNKVWRIPNILCWSLGIKHIIVPDSVREIGRRAFEACENAEDIIIGSSVERIEEKAFFECFNVSKIYSKIKDPKGVYYDLTHNEDYNTYIVDEEYDIFGRINKETCILYVPQGTLSDYQTTAPWSDFLNIVEHHPADTNLDGFVTSADATVVYDLLLGIDEAAAAASDVNGDGSVTVADITAIYNILMGNE